MTTTTEPTPPAAALAEPAFTPVVTLVLWLGCLLVGALGFAFPYARPRPPAVTAPSVQLELLQVELTRAPTPTVASVTAPPSALSQPPPLFAPAPLLPPPQLVAVERPSPAVAFAVPIEAPARIVEVKPSTLLRPAPQTAPVAPSLAPSPVSGPGAATGTSSGTAAVAAPAVEALTFGLGEGKQPAPAYPAAARRAGQEGTVVVRFSVGADGRVLAAEASSPAPWAALNHEALRVIREQWHFKPGPVRLHEVAIRFELKK